MKSKRAKVPCFFHEVQLEFKPLYEWAFGDKIAHPETTARAESILAALQGEPEQFDVREPPEIPLTALRAIHNYNLLTLYTTARSLPPDVTFYPSVFPCSDQTAGDPTNIQHSGRFCFDSGTPLNSDTWAAATWSAACAQEAAKLVRSGKYELTYALSRPPGHHASRDSFGGYCYFNNAAIAARVLRRNGRVVILDIDFHHGNGTQSIFYRDPKVLVISLHGDPRDCYPFFSGFSSETGTGPGTGFNLNLPLPKGTDGKKYVSVLRRHVVRSIKNFDPTYLILSAGLDTYVKDPVGDFTLQTDDFHTVGEVIGRMHLPTVVVQEGGYYTPHLGRNLRTLLLGLREGQAHRKRASRAA